MLKLRIPGKAKSCLTMYIPHNTVDFNACQVLNPVYTINPFLNRLHPVYTINSITGGFAITIMKDATITNCPSTCISRKFMYWWTSETGRWFCGKWRNSWALQGWVMEFFVLWLLGIPGSICSLPTTWTSRNKWEKIDTFNHNTKTLDSIL